MSDKERLEEILKDLKMKPADLAKELKPDSRVQWIYDITNEKISTTGKAVGISKETAKLIVDRFPQYSIAWVCFGVGEKFSDNTPKTTSRPKVSITIPKWLQLSLKQAASFLKIVSDNPDIFQDEAGTRLLEEIMGHGLQDSKPKKKVERQGSNQ